jgi:hypothetical protein
VWYKDGLMKNVKQLISDDELVRDRRYDLVAVKVKSVDARDATNGRPPTVVLEVLERYRGENRRKSLTVKWPAVPKDAPDEDPKARAKWLAKTYAGPAVDEAFIVLVEKSAGAASSVLTRCRLAYSPAERARVMTLVHITKPLGGPTD